MATDLERLLARLRAAFPGDPVGPSTMLLYEQRLDDLDVAYLSAAVNRLIDTERRFPVLAVILEAYDEQRRAGRDERRLERERQERRALYSGPLRYEVNLTRQLPEGDDDVRHD